MRSSGRQVWIILVMGIFALLFLAYLADELLQRHPSLEKLVELEKALAGRYQLSFVRLFVDSSSRYARPGLRLQYCGFRFPQFSPRARALELASFILAYRFPHRRDGVRYPLPRGFVVVEELEEAFEGARVRYRGTFSKGEVGIYLQKKSLRRRLAGIFRKRCPHFVRAVWRPEYRQNRWILEGEIWLNLAKGLSEQTGTILSLLRPFSFRRVQLQLHGSSPASSVVIRSPSSSAVLEAKK